MILRLCAVFVLLLAGPAAWAQSIDKGLPAAGATITLKPTSSGYEAGIILAREAKYTDAKISTTDPDLANLLDQRVDKEALPPAPAPAQPADQGKPPEQLKAYVKLVTVVLKSPAIRAGNYPLTLIAAGEGGPQVRDLVLAVPGAKIDPPDTLVIINNLWRSTGIFSANQPQIWETTQRAWLTHLSLDQKGNTDAGDKPAGRIMPKDALADIKPGHNGLIELNRQYSLDSNAFPLGTSKGKLVLQADQLAEPVTFGFEVRTRIWVCWLFLPMGIGLLLGYITRTTLTDRLKLNQERENTYALIALIDRAVARNADATFRQTAATIRQAALDAAKKSKAEDVKSATTPLQGQFQTALDDLNKRRGDLDKDIAALLSIVHGYYELPGAIAVAVREAKEALEAGLPELANNNVAGASNHLRNVRVNLCGTAVTAGNAWLRQVDNVAATLDLLTPLEATAVANLKTHWTTSRNATADAVQKLEADPDRAVANLQATLVDLHVGTNALRNVTVNVAAIIKNVVGGWVRILHEATLPKPEDWNAWQKQAKDFAAILETATPTDPDDAMVQFKDNAAALMQALKATLLGQAGDDAAAKKQIDDLMNANNYNQAISAIAAAHPPERLAVSKEGPLKGAAPAAAAGEAAAQNMFSVVQFAQPATSLARGAVGFATPPRQDLTPVDVLAAVAQRAVQETNWLLSWVYAALIAGAGYFLFADKWIGTPLDFALVFFWAYATDIGAEAATAAAKGVKRP